MQIESIIMTSIKVRKIISHDKDIHLSLGVARENVGNLLMNMCSTLQNNSYNSIPKLIVGCCTFIPAKALK